MASRCWRLTLTLLLLLGCGDKNKVTVSDAEPAADAKDSRRPVTGDWLLIHMLGDPEQLNPLTSND